MKALVLSSTYPDPTRPTHGVFVHRRVSALADRPEVLSVYVIAPTPWFRKERKDVPMNEERDGLIVEHPTFWYVPRFLKRFDGWFLYRSARATARRLANAEPDLIDAHFAWPDAYAAALLGRDLGLPVVVTLRGTLVWLFDDAPRRRKMAWALQRADRIVAVSTELADHAVKLGVDRAKIQVVPNGVDCEQYTVGDRKAARAELGLEPDATWLVTVGNLSPRKGFQRVIAALPKLADTNPGLRLAVVGGGGAEGDNGAELRTLVAKLGLESRVHFAGAQPPERVASYLSAADLFVLASSYEGSPNVVLEAQACGRPAVVGEVGEVRAMLPPTCGTIFSPADDVDALTHALRTALAADWDEAAIRAHAETQTWDGVADRVLHSWRAAVENHPRTREDAGNPVPPLTVGQDGNDR